MYQSIEVEVILAMTEDTLYHVDGNNKEEHEINQELMGTMELFCGCTTKS